LESLSQIWIDLNHLVALGGHHLIPDLDHFLDPRLKVILDHGVDKVAKPLLRNLMNLRGVRKILMHLVVLVAKLGDLVEREIIVLRH